MYIYVLDDISEVDYCSDVRIESILGYSIRKIFGECDCVEFRIYIKDIDENHRICVCANDSNFSRFIAFSDGINLNIGICYKGSVKISSFNSFNELKSEEIILRRLIGFDILQNSFTYFIYSQTYLIFISNNKNHENFKIEYGYIQRIDKLNEKEIDVYMYDPANGDIVIRTCYENFASDMVQYLNM